MYSISFYRNSKGIEPVYEVLKKLKDSKGKDSKILFNKMNDYIQLLSEHGLSLGEPYIKHIKADLWELRPRRDRIFFVAMFDDSFILIHHFVKKTQKTPKREIEKAEKIIKEIKNNFK